MYIFVSCEITTEHIGTMTVKRVFQYDVNFILFKIN